MAWFSALGESIFPVSAKTILRFEDISANVRFYKAIVAFSVCKNESRFRTVRTASASDKPLSTACILTRCVNLGAQMNNVFSMITYAAIAASSLTLASTASATGSNFDGQWDLQFVTQAGSCDPSYNFRVNISRGVITHPNLVRFKGNVSRGGSTRASVQVGDKFASGAGKLTRTSGGGSWNGRSGGFRCSGHWTAQRS